MLPPFIIEQIRKREEEDAWEGERPMLELPLPAQPPDDVSPGSSEGVKRGVVIIDLLG